jgi:hypothetical protein
MLKGKYLKFKYSLYSNLNIQKFSILSALKSMIMKRNRILVFIIIVLAWACSGKERKPLLPTVAGRAGEVTLVLNDAEWDTDVGEEFRRIFEKGFQMLPQYEPLFDIIHVTHKTFGNVFKSQRNIVITEILPRHKKPKIAVAKDIWAKPQIVISLYGDDDEAILALLKKHENKIIELLEDMERKRLMDIYMKNQDRAIVLKLQQEHNISVNIPKGYELDVDSSNFLWFNQETGSKIQGILVYHYDYTDENTFTPGFLISKRDKFLKKYLTGTVKGSYMTTEKEFLPIFSEYSLRGNRYVAELRGLWKMQEGISMGGPFISITTLDEKRNRVVTVEGFVYAAGFKKRNLVRQAEAIIYSLEINE